MRSNTLIIIPAYNEATVIELVLNNIAKKLPKCDVIVINDGSMDETEKIVLKFIASHCNLYKNKSNNDPQRTQKILFTSHPINLGQGAAISTGFDYAKKYNYDYILTVDADNQHDINDIQNIYNEILKNKSDFIIGSRIKDMKNKYSNRFFINFLSSVLTGLITKKYISDSQSGLRAFNKKAVNLLQINSCEPPGRENCSEIIIAATNLNLKTTEIPINAIYTEYSLSKGQRISHAFNMAVKVIFGDLWV